MIILTVLLLSVLLVLIYKYVNRNSDYWKKRNIVYRDDTLRKFVSGNRSLSEVYKDVYDEHQTEKNIGIFIGPKPALIIKDLENIQAVFAGDFLSFHSRGIVTNPNDLLADNILMMEDYQKWKLIRQKLSPVFTGMKLKQMFNIIEKSARDFVEFVEENGYLKKKPFNTLYTFSTASIGATVFGLDANTRNTMNSPFLEMTLKTVKPSFIANVKFFIANNSPKLFKFLNLKVFGEFEDFFITIVKKVLQARRNDLQRRNDFIDICVCLQQNGTMNDLSTGYHLEPTDELLAAQAFFFFIAGADPTANTMHFTLLELSFYPEILNKVHNEIDNVFNQHSIEGLVYEDIDKLTYLDMVVNEAMRKHPTIGYIQRRCNRDTELPVGKIKIEKDSIVVIPVLALHRDEKYYPNPEVFDPERFSPENISKIRSFSYLPFGGGNRRCIGARYARLQVMAGLAWLLRRFTLKEQSPTPYSYEASFFSVRAPTAHYELILRADECQKVKY